MHREGWVQQRLAALLLHCCSWHQHWQLASQTAQVWCDVCLWFFLFFGCVYQALQLLIRFTMLGEPYFLAA
jgi:hypothetical protein